LVLELLLLVPVADELAEDRRPVVPVTLLERDEVISRSLESLLLSVPSSSLATKSSLDHSSTATGQEDKDELLVIMKVAWVDNEYVVGNVLCVSFLFYGKSGIQTNQFLPLVKNIRAYCCIMMAGTGFNNFN